MPRVMERSQDTALEVLPRVKKSQPLEVARKGVRAKAAVDTSRLLPERSGYSQSDSAKERP